MRETSCSVSLLSLIAPLFSSLSEQEYAEVRENPAWDAVCAASSQEAADPAERETLGCACALPDWPQRSLLQNELLVSGMPLAAMPVESLYKPWSSDSRNAYGAQRGLYRGEPARHMQSVYASLDIEVPERFAAMPDHLTLELELLALLLEAGNAAAAATVAFEHLDWLDDYDAALARRARDLADATRLNDACRAQLAEGIAHLRTLVAVACRTAREAAAAGEPAAAQPCARVQTASRKAAPFREAAPAREEAPVWEAAPAWGATPTQAAAPTSKEPLALCGDVR